MYVGEEPGNTDSFIQAHCFDWQASDLKYLLQQYEHWANTLFPKLTFKDVTDKIESLASKKSFKVS